MLQSVEVCHEGRWIAATMMSTRHDADGGYGLVGYTDPMTKSGYYRWVHERFLRDAPGAEVRAPLIRPGPGA